MTTKSTVNDGNKSSIVNFGFYGWVTILYCLAMFWFYVGMCNDGSNFTTPAVAQKLGVENGLILNMNAIAGLVGVAFFIIVGKINEKVGPRWTSGVLNIIAGVAYYMIGNVNSVIGYAVAMSFVVGAIMSAGYVAGGTLVAQWFPKKKGIVMGYTTMGHNLASAFYVPIIGFLVGSKGIHLGVLPISIALIILGLLGMIFIRNYPHDRGQNPDHVSDEVFAKEYDVTDEHESRYWNTKKLLATKELWLAAISTGFFQICSVGVMTQLVLRNVELGFELDYAVKIMTVLAVGGVGGSWLIGVFDQKLGTKKTMIGFGIWYAMALILNFTGNMTLVYVSLFMIAVGIGGSANFTTSLPAAIFGRHEFDKVNSVIFPIQGAITAMSFLINGVVQIITNGEIRMVYLVFAGIAIINIIIVIQIDEYKYNRDHMVANGINPMEVFK